MKRKHLLLAGMFVAGVSGAACYDVTSDPTIFLQGVGVDGAGTGGAGGGTTTNPPECIPNQTGNPVADTCGVFVSSSKGSDDGGDGTKDKPFATLGKALEQGSRVYACAESFSGALALDMSATIYGGLDCAGGWKYIGETAKTKLEGLADKPALRAKTGADLHLQDVAVLGANAEKQGGASIALLAEAASTVELVRCEVMAGNGKQGADGETPSGTGTPGPKGIDGVGSCADLATNPGGLGGANTCDADIVDGGSGGNGQKANSGGVGNPGSNGAALGAAGGAAQTMTACTNGGDGDAGLPGEAGVGAANDQGGAISSSGFTAAPGGDGKTAGTPGAGAGGGGGAKTCVNGNAGPSGGGGGAAGCGGLPGKGGLGGGASIGVLSLSAKLAFTDVTITAKSGGAGGAGGGGQPGGSGGAGGVPGIGDATAIGCAGGKGGDGGLGGRGGGGRGGHSIGIAYTGDAPSTQGVTINHGTPGEGGNGDGDMGAGAQGVAADTQAFAG